MKTKDMVFAASIAAIYFALTVTLGPLSYGPIQFRVSEFLKFFALFNPWTGLGLAIGDLLSSMVSPYIGPWEMIFMPLADAIGATLVFHLFRLLKQAEWAKYLLMALYAILTGLAVASMMYAFGADLFFPLLVSITISELIILLASVPIGNQLVKAMKAINSRMFTE